MWWWLMIINLTVIIRMHECITKVIGYSEIHDLEIYEQYFSIAVVHFNIPVDVQNVSFVFDAISAGTSFLPYMCPAYDVTVCMKQGSLPVVSPEQSPFPESFVNLTLRPNSILLHFKANHTKQYINITTPQSGNWFGIAYRSWIHPGSKKINLQDMSKLCTCVLHSYAIVTLAEVDNVDTAIPLKLLIPSTQPYRRVLKFDATNKLFNNLKINLNLKTCSGCSQENIYVYLQTLSIATETNYLHKIVLNQYKSASFTDIISVDMYSIVYFLITHNPSSSNDSLMYNTISIDLRPLENVTINKQEMEESQSNKSIEQANVTKMGITHDPPEHLTMYLPSKNKILYDQHTLIKLSSRKSLSFTYIIKPNLQMKTPKMINLTSSITVLKFTVAGVDEIGGTLYMAFALNPRRNVTKPYVILVCIRRFAIEIPTLPNKCIYYQDISNASIVLHSSSRIGSYEYLHIPYPEIGNWYVSIRIFPYDNSTEAKATSLCSDDCEDFYKTCIEFCASAECKDSCAERVYEEAQCANCGARTVDMLKTERRTEIDLKDYNASIIFSLAVSPCIDESCGPHGECRIIADNTIMFSTCICNHKYLGWDCSNGKIAEPRNMVIMEMLLLTLSNLGFVVSVGYSIAHKYYTEAVVYLMTMFFSFAYHACDAGNGIYSICLVQLYILKFCDFYCGLLAVWITLVAMAHCGPHLTSVCQMLGAVLLAFGTSYNMEGVLVFIIPVVTGILLIIVSWGLYCRETRECFPEKRYLFLYFPFGLIMVTTGIITYSFLQTAQNYKYIHSCWHILMALSVVVLLPNKNMFIPKV